MDEDERRLIEETRPVFPLDKRETRIVRDLIELHPHLEQMVEAMKIDLADEERGKKRREKWSKWISIAAPIITVALAGATAVYTIFFKG